MNALYVGSFDPITKGHLDIIYRASHMFDELYVGVLNNSAKHYYFTDTERSLMTIKALQEMQSKVCCGKIKVFPHVIDSITTDLMHSSGAEVLVRGIRNSKDMEDELILNGYYKQFDPQFEEVFLVTNYPNISSTFVRECINYGKTDVIKDIVPEAVMEVIKSKPKLV